MINNKPKVYYINHEENDVYRVDAEGFTRDTGEKRCILRNLTDGKRWDIAAKDLAEVRLIDGTVQNVWELMPQGWYPKKEEDEYPYPGYTDDPRKEPTNYGNNGYVQRPGSYMPAINRFNKGRAGFKR